MRLIDADALICCLGEEPIVWLSDEYATGLRDQWRIDISTIKAAPTVSGWISVKDRLPDDGEHVLAYIERDSWTYGTSSVQRKREIAIGYHVSGHWNVDGCNKVIGICWMPLPEPPKEE